MDLKPQKILEVEFSRAFRGYNEDEVNDFIEEVASAVEIMLKEKEKLQEENEEYKRKLSELTQYIQRLEGNLEEWKKQIEVEKELTRRESQMYLKEAQIKGNRIVDEALKKKKEIEVSYSDMREKYRLFQIRFKSLLQTFMDSIDWKEKPPAISASESDNVSNGELQSPDDITLFSFRDLKDDEK